MRKFLNKSLWISLYLLFPVTLVGLFAQNAIPGDFLYPVKLGMENVGAFVFSLTPEAKASYDSTLTQRRFEEAEKLITYEANTSGLDTLVVQATKTQESVGNVQDQKQKEVLQEKLISDINAYQEKLTQTQQKVDPTYIAPTPTPTPVLPTSRKPNAPKQAVPTAPLQPPRNSPSPNPTTTTAPTPTGPATPPDIVNNIEQTKQKLEQIKQYTQFQSMQIQSTAPTPTQPPSTPTPFAIPSVTNFQSPSSTPNVPSFSPSEERHRQEPPRRRSSEWPGSSESD